MEVWVLVLEFLALLGLTGCGAQEEEEAVELTFDDIIGGNESWDESEIYEEARTNEDQQGNGRHVRRWSAVPRRLVNLRP